MAQDYHIYIHSDSGNDGGNKTTPFSAKKESSFGTKAVSKINQGLSYATGESSLIQTGAAKLTKAVPAVAVTLGLFAVVKKVLSIGFAHQAEYQGNYENQIAMNNFFTLIGNAINPIGFHLNIIKREKQFNKQNKELEQQRMLISDVVFNDFRKTGI